MKKYITECIGTFFLVLTIALTGNPIAIGTILMVMVYMGGYISGAHYNPAVTFSIYLCRKISGKDALKYMLFQLLGGILAMLFFKMLYGSTRSFVPAPDFSISIIKPLLIETIFAFALSAVVLNVAVSRKTAGNSYYGLAIGFTILAAAYAGGTISGGVFNPAVGTAPIIIDTILGGNSYQHLWLYVLGPLAGGVLGAAFFSYCNPEEIENGGTT